MSVTIGNSTAPSETTILAAKNIEIQCPKTAEQKDTEAFDEQQIAYQKQKEIPSVQEYKESEDEDYNPAEEPEENVSSEEESESQQSESEYKYQEEEEFDEEEIVNSKEFQEEFAEAMENVRDLAQKDGQKILEKVLQDYYDETGMEATEQEIADALDTCAIGPNQEETEEEIILNSQEFQEEFAEAIENVQYIAKIDGQRIIEKVEQNYFDEEVDDTDASVESDEEESVYESVSEAEYEMEEEWEVEYEVELDEDEFAEALDIVRDVAKYDQELFVNELCDTFVELNGEEPTVEQLENVFGRIKANFADEAREEFLEENDAESDSDSDYEATGKELKQIEKDNKYDSKLRTQIVFVDNETETESEFDSEYDSEYKTDEFESDDEDDSDYSPEQDAFDYTQDDKDEEQFEVELKGTDENEVECEDYQEDMVDIE